MCSSVMVSMAAKANQNLVISVRERTRSRGRLVPARRSRAAGLASMRPSSTDQLRTRLMSIRTSFETRGPARLATRSRKRPISRRFTSDHTAAELALDVATKNGLIGRSPRQLRLRMAHVPFIVEVGEGYSVDCCCRTFRNRIAPLDLHSVEYVMRRVCRRLQAD